jgi:hypothetical protein
VIYVLWYLGVGIVVLAALFINHNIIRKYEPTSFHDILAATDPDRQKLSYKILNNVAVPLLGLCIWPLAIYLIIQDYFQIPRNELRDDPQLFSVKPADLTERLTINEIERRETYLDPLLAVPALPFGHLNQRWKDFTSSHSADDELWAFTANWETDWGGKELRKGYVSVRSGVPGAHFLSVRKNLSDDD